MNLKQAKELVRGRLSDKRYEHTLNVKKMAVKLAKIYGEDEERAALAALLHDSAKEISKDEMREILRAYPQYAEGGEERPAPVWHGVCAAILARTQWGGAGLARRGKAAQAGKKESGCRYAGRAEADQRFCALAGQAP